MFINIKMISKVIGSLLGFEAFFFLLCEAVSFLYQETNTGMFLIPCSLALLVGSLLRFYGKKSPNKINKRDSYLIIIFSWLTFTAFGIIPFLLSGYVNSFVDALFETMSGFSTTGASVLNNIDDLPHSLLFWRSLTQWLGGLGIVFFTLALLPSVGMRDVKLFSAESTGLKIGKLHPRISVTAKWIWGIYVFFTVSITVALYFGGMNLFDSINHAFTTVATGGFSTHQEGIPYFHSPTIEYIIIISLFLVGINFTLYYLFLIKRNLKIFFSDGEFKTYLLLFFSSSLIIIFSLVHLQHYPIEKAIRETLFQVASLYTTCGYVSANFMNWPSFTWIILLLLMFIGACAGSTSGGYKSIRVYTVYKLLVSEFKQILHPHAIFSVKIGQTSINSSIVRTLLVFSFLYISLIFIGSILLVIAGSPILDAFSICISSIGGVGPGVGHLIGGMDTWAALPDFSKLVCVFLMLAGRLEIICLLLPFFPNFWSEN